MRERNEKENETESCDKSIRQVRPRKESFQWKTVSAKNADSRTSPGIGQLFANFFAETEEEEEEEEEVPPPKSSRNSFPFKPVTRKHEQPPLVGCSSSTWKKSVGGGRGLEKIGDSSTGVSHLVTVYCSKQLLTPIEKAEFVWKKFVEGRKGEEEHVCSSVHQKCKEMM